MFPGWSLPTIVTVVSGTIDYRDEIMEHVVHPCYLDIARRNTVEGISPEAYAAILLVMVPDDVNKMVQSVTTLVASLETFEERAVLYNMSRMLCIQSARES